MFKSFGSGCCQSRGPCRVWPATRPPMAPVDWMLPAVKVTTFVVRMLAFGSVSGVTVFATVSVRTAPETLAMV